MPPGFSTRETSAIERPQVGIGVRGLDVGDDVEESIVEWQVLGVADFEPDPGMAMGAPAERDGFGRQVDAGDVRVATLGHERDRAAAAAAHVEHRAAVRGRSRRSARTRAGSSSD